MQRLWEWAKGLEGPADVEASGPINTHTYMHTPTHLFFPHIAHY